MQGGPSLNSDSGLLISNFSSCSGVILYSLCNEKNSSIVIALPFLSNAYRVVFLQLKYGKLRKFPVSSCDFNSTCLGNTSAPPCPKIALTDNNLSLIKLASTATVVNKNTCAPPLLDLNTISGKLQLKIFCINFL